MLDASALLCLIRHEPGAEVVAELLPNAIISAVNLSETVAKLADVGMDSATVGDVLGPLKLRVAPFDEAAAYAAGLLRPATPAAGLSLGDRACIALTLHLGAEAATADRAWERADLGVAIRWVR